MSNSIFANQAQVREREQEKIEKKVERANAPRKTETLACICRTSSC